MRGGGVHALTTDHPLACSSSSLHRMIFLSALWLPFIRLLHAPAHDLKSARRLCFCSSISAPLIAPGRQPRLPRWSSRHCQHTPPSLPPSPPQCGSAPLRPIRGGRMRLQREASLPCTRGGRSALRRPPLQHRSSTVQNGAAPRRAARRRPARCLPAQCRPARRTHVARTRVCSAHARARLFYDPAHPLPRRAAQESRRSGAAGCSWCTLVRSLVGTASSARA